MNPLRSIRARLTAWYTLLLAFTLGLFGASAYLFTRSSLSSTLDRSLREEVRWVNEFIEPKAKKVRLKPAALRELQELQREALPDTTRALQEDTAGIDELWRQIYQHTLLSPRRQLIQILDRNGDLLYKSPGLGEANLLHDAVPFGSIEVVTIRGEDGNELRLATTQNEYVKIFVAYPLRELNDVLANLFSNLLYLAPAALLISMVGGWILASKSLKPVDILTKTAREITAENLNRRLPSYHIDDEIGRLTATLNDMIARLHASFSQIQQFSADASHELRTPLTIMRGEIEVALRNGKLPRTTRELLVSTHDELVRLSSIVDNLMTLITSESGRQTLRLEPVPLARLIQSVADDSRLLAGKKHIKVQLDVASDVVVSGDPARLRQLFLNLIDNAIKYTSPHGRIRLHVGRSDGRAVATVQDTGVGIPRKDLPHIFDRFYRVHRDNADDAGGSGLGLSIARWITEAHHGTIEVQSREKKGTKFIVSLPLASERVS